MNTHLPVSCCSRQSQPNNTSFSKFTLLFFSLLMMGFLQSATAQITALSSGSWNDPAIWDSGTVPTVADDVVVNSNFIVTVTATGAICNNLQLGLGDENQNGDIDFSGTSGLTVANGIILGDIDGALGTITMGASATITCGTISEGYPGISGVYNTNNGTIVFTGLCVLPQTLTQFNNLIVNSSTTSLVYSNIDIYGNLTVNSGATFFLTTFTANRFTAGGTLTVANGGSLRMAGNVTLPSNFSTHSIGGTSTIDYRGTSAQNIAPLNSAQKYGNLTVQGSTKTLTGSATVAGTLLFAGSGTKLAIANNTLTLEGAISGSTTSRYFSCSSGSNLTLKGTVNRTLFFDQTTPGTTNALTNLTINHSTYIATLGSALTVKGVLTFTAGKLAIAANTFTLAGTVTNTVTDGLTGGTTSNLVFSNTAAGASVSMDQTTDGTTNRLNNLTINSSSRTLTLTNSLKLSGTLQPTSGILASAGNLTLLSSASRTANVAAGSASGGYVTGNVVVERYASSGRKWQLLSVPTTGSQTVNAAWQEGTASGSSGSTGYGTWITTNDASAAGNGFDYVTPGTSIKTYDASSGTWITLPGTYGPIASTDAYMIFIRGDRGCTSFNSTVSTTVLRSAGVLRQGTQTSLTVPAGKNMTIANAFPSPVDFRLLTKSSAVDDLFYVWDPKLGGSLGLGGYQTFTLSSGNYVITPGSGSYGAGGSIVNTIQPGQGFFVHATGSNGTLQFVESAKSSTNQLVSRPMSPSSPQVRINLYSGTSNFKMVDGVFVEMAESFSSSFDREDALKIFNNNETFAVASNKLNLSVERRPSPQTADTIFLNSFGLRTLDYQLEIVPAMMETFSMEAFLEDTYLGFKYPLNLSDTNRVQFKTTTDPASKSVSRFRIIFKPAVVLPVTFTGINAVQNDSGIDVSWQTTNEINTKNYVVERSADGVVFKEFYSVAAINGGSSLQKYTWLDETPLTGENFYRVKCIDINGAVKFSRVVVVNIRKPETVNVFPNPVMDKQINVSLAGMLRGTCNYFIFNSAGGTIASGTIEVSSSDLKVILIVPQSTTSGKYQLLIKSKDFSNTTDLLIL